MIILSIKKNILFCAELQKNWSHYNQNKKKDKKKRKKKTKKINCINYVITYYTLYSLIIIIKKTIKTPIMEKSYSNGIHSQSAQKIFSQRFLKGRVEKLMISSLKLIVKKSNVKQIKVFIPFRHFRNFIQLQILSWKDFELRTLKRYRVLKIEELKKPRSWKPEKFTLVKNYEVFHTW